MRNCDCESSKDGRRCLLRLGIAMGLTLMLPWQAVAQDLRTVSSSLATRIEASGRQTVAVADFTDLQGNVTELGRFLAEELSVALFGDAKTFRVIDRAHLKALLQEHKLAATGLIDPQTARQLGKIAGVDTLVTGTTTALGDNVRLSTKVLDTTTAQMIAASTIDVPKTKAIEELLARGIGSQPSGVNGGSLAPAAGSSAMAARPRTTFKTVSVSLDSLRVLADNTVVVTLRFLNSGTRELLAALDENSRNIYLGDNAGNQYFVRNTNGIGNAQFINIRRGSSGWLTCPSNTEVTASIVFAPPRNMDARGKTFSLAIPVHVGTYYVDNYGYSKVTEDGNFNISFRDVGPM